jgi:hypothetical protein
LHSRFEFMGEHEICVGAKRAYFPGRVLRIPGWFAESAKSPRQR